MSTAAPAAAAPGAAAKPAAPAVALPAITKNAYHVPLSSAQIVVVDGPAPKTATLIPLPAGAHLTAADAEKLSQLFAQVAEELGGE